MCDLDNRDPQIFHFVNAMINSCARGTIVNRVGTKSQIRPLATGGVTTSFSRR